MLPLGLNLLQAFDVCDIMKIKKIIYNHIINENILRKTEERN